MTAPADDTTVRRIALSWRELRRGASGAALRRHLLGPDGPPLEQAQLDALDILVAGPTDSDGWRMSDFADAMRVDASTATRVIMRLERHGLAERVRSTDDGRIVVARPTASGRRMIKRVSTLRAAGMERLLEPFDPGEREQFAEYLERFVGSIDTFVTDVARTEGA